MESKGEPKRSKPTNHSHIPSELITEIFLRLPVKSLLKFRSVSKYWLHIISSPEFIKFHLSLSSGNKENTHHRLLLRICRPVYCNILKDCSLKSLLYESVTEASDLKIPMKNPYKLFRILGSVNGLICLICLARGTQHLFLWNPSTRKYRKLPYSGTELISGYRYGFTYDESRDDYKIVVIFHNFEHDSSDRVKVKLYSLTSNSWKDVDDCPSGKTINGSGKFVNGKLHWATTTTTRCDNMNIISIDLEDEKWRKVEQPSYGKGDSFLWLEVLGSDLSVLCDNEGKRDFSIWVMKEYGVKESWTKMFTFKHANYLYVYSFPFFLSNNKGEILDRVSQSFKIYNKKDDLFSPKIINFDDCSEAEIYVESLVSPFPKGGTSDATKAQAKKAQIMTIKQSKKNDYRGHADDA